MQIQTGEDEYTALLREGETLTRAFAARMADIAATRSEGLRVLAVMLIQFATIGAEGDLAQARAYLAQIMRLAEAGLEIACDAMAHAPAPEEA